ncbi:response regulator [Nitrogeniibacter aestuarii]|uniref:response regulator n=1 Tax=Nitrogeniibacter aestuarii TaxID=2815343 RepID=UPI001D10D883|nr:response regulator [Nitrogeniibacter aestuarii]
MRPKRMLAVDDVPAVRKIVADVGRDFGFDVIHAGNGQPGNFFDVIVTDAQMPLMHGGQFVRALRECGIRTPVVVIPLSPEQRVMRELARVGINAVVPKPFRLADLYRAFSGLGHVRRAVPRWDGWALPHAASSS